MWEIEYYETESGKCPVADFLLDLPIKQRVKAIRQIDLLGEKGTQLKEPHVKHIDGQLWELRIKFAKDIQRIFYFLAGDSKFVLLHGFIKKTKVTPPKEIKRAHKYREDHLKRSSL